MTTENRTTKVTTQRGVRTVEHNSLQRNFCTNDRQLRYRRLNTTMLNDTYFSSIKSTRGNTCAQIWKNDIEWIRIDPMSTKSNALHSAKMVCHQRFSWTVLGRNSWGNSRRLVKMQRYRYRSSNTILLGQTGMKVRPKRIKELQDVQ